MKNLLITAAVLGLLLAPSCSNNQQQNKVAPPMSPTLKTKKINNYLKAVMKEISLENQTGQPDVTRNFYFIMDGSGSMNESTGEDCGDSDGAFSTKIAGANWAITEFLKQVPGDVNMGLYIFDHMGAEERAPLGPADHDKLLHEINEMRVGGRTPLAPAIMHATDTLVEQYKKQLGYGEYRIVIVTDGQAEHIPEAATYAAEYGIPIYSIGLCVGPDHPLRTFSVSYWSADNFEDLAKGLKQTIAELPQFDAKGFE